MPRGRPRKIKPEEPVEIIEKVEEPIKYRNYDDNRIDKNSLPIKYNEDLLKEIRGGMMIYPKHSRTLTSQAVRMIDYLVGVLDELDKSGIFEEDGGWRKKYNIVPPRIQLPKYTEEELDD